MVLIPAEESLEDELVNMLVTPTLSSEKGFFFARNQGVGQ
jgi:hypothetical protein